MKFSPSLTPAICGDTHSISFFQLGSLNKLKVIVFTKHSDVNKEILRFSQKSKNSDKIILQICRGKLLNIINIYSKIIGTECTNMYCNLGLIKLIKGSKYIHLIKTTKNFYGFIGDKLPRLYLKKNLLFSSSDYKVEKFNSQITLYQIFNLTIEKDNMESYILDSNIWHKSIGKTILNLPFIAEILKNYLNIIKRLETTKKLKNTHLCFLEALFDIDLIKYLLY
jgi:hypothetical protein